MSQGPGGGMEGPNQDNNHIGGAGPILNTNRVRNNNNQNPLFNVRDRLFHALFFKAAIAYARTFPRSVRRFIEFVILLKAITAFFVLAYIHVAFSRTPTTCLEHVRDQWPRDGILRVEILRNADQDYNIEQSYAKEEKLKQEKVEDLATMLGLLARDGFINIEPSAVDELTEPLDDSEVVNHTTESSIVSTDVDIQPNSINSSRDVSVSVTVWDGLSPLADPPTPPPDIDENKEPPVINETIIREVFEAEPELKTDVPQVEKFVRAVWPEDEYIVEYSLEYGFLRLSPATRQRLGIPVKIVTLDPNKDSCFGDPFSRFILDEFLGYDDLLMASIKTLAEQEDNKGYLRNVVTGEHYRFVSMWMARSSYLAAFFIMIVFTVSISMLLRYSHHQIFVFIVDLLQMLEFNVTVTFPAAPLLTVILALVVYIVPPCGQKGALMSKLKVLITNSGVPRIAFDLLSTQFDVIYNEGNSPSRADIIQKIKGCHALIWSTKEYLDKEILDAAGIGPQLRVVSTMSVGYDHINVAEVKSRGIFIGNTANIPNKAVADIAVLLVLAATRRAHEGYLQMNSGQWNLSVNWLLGQDIVGSTVGIVGLGSIGLEIVKRLKGFEVKEFIYTGHKEKQSGIEIGAKFVSFDELLSKSDIVIAACPCNSETHEMFNKNVFKKMKPTSIFVNIARGKVVDQDALIEALETNTIFAAGLDVMTPEPLPPGHKLYSLPNCGMEAIMSEFFNDTTTAFYIILIVWIADQYDAICCHTPVTKRHWLRFFYLYHFSFYAYHYRFNGQYSSLALVTSWLFIQHSMLYFFHHYELPVILQQAQLQHILRNHQQAAEALGGRAGAGPAEAPPLATRLSQLLGAVRSSTTPAGGAAGGAGAGAAGAAGPGATATTQTSRHMVATMAQTSHHVGQTTVGTSATPVTSSHASQTPVSTVEDTAQQTDRPGGPQAPAFPGGDNPPPPEPDPN